MSLVDKIIAMFLPLGLLQVKFTYLLHVTNRHRPIKGRKKRESSSSSDTTTDLVAPTPGDGI